MNPTWKIGDGSVQLYLGRCEDILPTFPAGSFHACVTDPPYGIGADARQVARAGKQHGKAFAPSKDYGDALWDHSPMSPEALACIMAVSRWQIIFGGNHFPLPPSRCVLVWDKLTGNNDYADCELAWTNLDKPVRKLAFQWHGMLRDEDCERIHPTQKPVGVMQWCLGHLPKPVGRIAEPYMGSGSTVIACIRMGIPVVAIEEHEPYFEGAIKRIEAEFRRAPLFEAPPLIIQQTLALE
jgi:DNA modification methylase